MPPEDEKVAVTRVLDDAVRGPHGEAAYRHVGEYVRESVDDQAEDDGETHLPAAHALLNDLEDAVRALRKRLNAAVRVPRPDPADPGRVLVVMTLWGHNPLSWQGVVSVPAGVDLDAAADAVDGFLPSVDYTEGELDWHSDPPEIDTDVPPGAVPDLLIGPVVHGELTVLRAGG